MIASRVSVRAAHNEDSLAGALLEARDTLHGPVTREGREREGRGLGKLDILRLLGQETLLDERVLGEHALPTLHRRVGRDKPNDLVADLQVCPAQVSAFDDTREVVLRYSWLLLLPAKPRKDHGFVADRVQGGGFDADQDAGAGRLGLRPVFLELEDFGRLS